MKRGTVSEQHSGKALTEMCRKLFWGGRLFASKSGSDGSGKLIKPMKFPSVRWTLSPVCSSVQKHSVGWLNTDFVSKGEQELFPLHWKDNSVTLCTLFFLLLHTFHGLQERKLWTVKAKNHFRQSAFKFLDSKKTMKNSFKHKRDTIPSLYASPSGRTSLTKIRVRCSFSATWAVTAKPKVKEV